MVSPIAIYEGLSNNRKQVTQQQFFWIQVGVAAFIAALFLWGRRSKPSTSRLHLKNKSIPTQNAANKDLQPAYHQAKGLSSKVRSGAFNFNSEIKILNVIFNYNGHSFDAHEVLGVAPGSSFEQIREAFNQAVSERASQKEFLTAAMSAILEEYKKASAG